MDKYKKLASNTLIFAIGTFSSKILSFLLMPFVTRMMGTGDYGSADLVQQTVNVLIPVVTLLLLTRRLTNRMFSRLELGQLLQVLRFSFFLPIL